MAAATVYNTDHFDSTTGHPLYASGHPRKSSTGLNVIPFSYTIATTSLDDIGDRVRLVPLPNGAKDCVLLFNCGDLDSATSLDADLVLREDATDTIIYNAGAGFQSAHASKLVVFNMADPVAEPDGLDASIDFLVNAAAGTEVEGTIEGVLIYRT